MKTTVLFRSERIKQAKRRTNKYLLNLIQRRRIVAGISVTIPEGWHLMFSLL
jgi:hypothetical protein